MKKVIKHPNKVKNAMYIVFGVFALALFIITRTGSSYATDGLNIDKTLDAIVLYGEVNQLSEDEEVEEVQEIEKIQEVEEEKDIVEPEETSNEDMEGKDETYEDLDETVLEKDNKEIDKPENKEENQGVSDENMDNEKGKEEKQEIINENKTENVESSEEFGFMAPENRITEEVQSDIIESEEIYGTGEYEGVKVEVYAQTGAFPLGTTLNIIPITGDAEMNDIQDVLEEQKNIEKAEKVVAFDITFLDLETNEELQPLTGTVQVSFNYEDNEELKAAEEDEEQEVKIYHLNDKDEEGEKIEEIKDVVVEEVVINEEKSEDENVMVVEAENFSVYTIVTQIRDSGSKGIEDQLENFVYGSISIENPDNPGQGITIMDRNLGAIESGTGVSAYGYYYQWGNNYGFDYDAEHKTLKNGTFGTYGENAVEWNSNYANNGYYGNIFVEGSSEYTPRPNYKDASYDYWKNNMYYDSLRGGGGDTYKSDSNNDRRNRQGPCPEGWHIPSNIEWQNLMKYWNNSENGGLSGVVSSDGDFQLVNSATPFLEYFKLPNAGSISEVGKSNSIGYSSSSRFNTSYRYVSNFTSVSSRLQIYVTNRSSGHPIRCFKNVYTPELYKVTFHFDGLRGLIVEESVGQDGKVKEPSNTNLTGFVIKWYDNPELSGNTFDFNSVITSNLDLYAKYNCSDGTSCDRIVTFQTNGGTEIPPIVLSGFSILQKPQSPIKEGFVFMGWYLDPNFTQKCDFSKEILVDTTLYAKRGIPKILTLNANSGVFEDGENVKMMEYGIFMDGKRYSYTENLSGDGTKIGDYGNNWNNSNIRGTDRGLSDSYAHVLRIPGVDALKVTVTWGGQGNSYDWVSVWKGNYPLYTATSNYSSAISFASGQKLGGGKYTSASNTQTVRVPGNTVTFSFKSNGSGTGDGYGYYAVVEGIISDLGYDTNPETPTPTREGYEFLGWYEKSIPEYYNITDKLYDDKILYARWGSGEEIDSGLTATLLTGENFNTTIKTYVKGSTVYYSSTEDSLVREIKRAEWWPQGVTNYIRLSTNDSETPVYARYVDGVLYYYTEANIIYLNEKSSNMFYNFEGLVSIDMRNWNTSRVTSMYSMFNGCSKLTNIDVSSWDTSNVTDMGYMFDDCNSLTGIDVSNWDTSDVTRMFNMFYNCSNLTNLDVSNWNTSNVTSMSYMFYNCSNLTNLDVSNWNTSNVTSMSYMFNGGSKLTNLEVDGWNVNNVTNMSYMFSGCSKLTNLGVGNWNVDNVTDMSAMFFYCNSLTGIDVSNWDTSNVTSMSYMFSYCSSLKNINVSNWDTSSVTSMYRMFVYNSSLEKLDLTNWNTSSVSNMMYMFYGCSKLKTIYVGMRFRTSNVSSSSKMFTSASSLVGGNGTPYNSSYVDKSYARIDKEGQPGYFTQSGSNNLSVAYLMKGSSFNTTIKSLATGGTVSSYSESDTIITGFQRAETIPTGVITGIISAEDSDIPVYAWFKDGIIYYHSEADIIEMNGVSSYMFYNLKSLKNVDLSGLDRSNVTYVNYMFNGCSSLKSLDVSNWNVSNVTNMFSMFNGCSSLKSLDVSNWNVSNVTSMGSMFNGCSSLENLDISNRNTKRNSDIGSMFYNCDHLKTIYASGSFKNNTSNYSNAFYGATSLVGGNGSTIDKLKKVDYTYAKIDNESQSGYFTDINNFAVRYLSTTGIELSKQWISSGSKVSEFEDDSHRTYHYYTSNSLQTEFNFELPLYAYTEIYVIWDNLNTVNYDYKSHSGLNENTGFTVSNGTGLQLPTEGITSEKGYSFIGWTTEKKGTIPLESNTYTVTDDVTFYPVFKKDSVTKKIKFYKNGNDGYTYSGSNYTGDKEFILCTIQERYNADEDITTCSENIVFPMGISENTPVTKGWTRNSEGEGIIFTGGEGKEIVSEDEPIAFYLQMYSPEKVYKANYEYGTGVEEGLITSGSCNIAETKNGVKQMVSCEVNLPDLIAKIGYSAPLWYKKGEGQNYPDLKIALSGNENLEAIAQANQYKIIFDTDGGNEISPIAKDYNSVINITLPIATKDCNEFSGWNIELPERMPAHDITLKASRNYTCSNGSSSGGGGRKSGNISEKITPEINIENEHNSADEKDNLEKTEINKTTLNDEVSSQIISEAQEISEDGAVGTIVETVKIKNTDIVAIVRTEVISSSLPSNSNYTKEQNEAYSFAKSNGITTTSSLETAKMNTELTRIQMAKMLSNFAINVLGQEPDISKGTVKFKDVTNKMDRQYDNAVTKAYQLGIMGQNVKNKEFRPNDKVTRAEFATALSRLLYKTDEGKYKGTGKYYEPHIAKLYNEGIINKADPSIKEKRGYVMLMLMRTVK